MIDLGRSRLFQRSVFAIYCVVLPLLVLSAIGAVFAEGMAWRWPVVAGCLLGAVLIGWRLRLYGRAFGLVETRVPTRRLLFVLMPLGVLALAGSLAVLVGLSWIVIGFYLTFGPLGGEGGLLGLVVTGGAGVVLAAIGAAAIAPFVFALKRRRAAEDVLAAFEDEDDPGEGAPPA